LTPVERLVENAWFQRLKLKHENLLSSFASNFNLRHYTKVWPPKEAGWVETQAWRSVPAV